MAVARERFDRLHGVGVALHELADALAFRVHFAGAARSEPQALAALRERRAEDPAEFRPLQIDPVLLEAGS